MQISLKGKLLIGISGLILILTAVLTFNNYQETKEIIITKEEEYFSVLQNIVQMEVSDYLVRGALLAASIVEDQVVVDAFGDRDRYRLKMAVKARFDTLQNQGVNVLQFHLPDGTSFYRAHEPDKYGDNLLFRRTISEVITNQQPIAGLEEDEDGFSLRAVQPVWEFGRYIGSVEVGIDVGNFLAEELKEVIDSDFFVYFHNSVDGGSYLLGSTLEQDDYPVPEELISRLKETGEYQYTYSRDGTKALVLVPLREVGGTVTGYIKVLQPRDQVLAQIRRQVQEAIFIGLAGLAVVVLILWRVLLFFLRPLEALCRQMGIIASSGDLTRDALVAEEAEIGQVAVAYNTMLGSLREIIHGIRTSAGRLQDWSHRLATGAEEASAAGEELSAIAEQNTIGAEKQVEAIEQIKGIVAEMTGDAGTMARKAAETGQKAGNALEVTRQGEEYVRDSVRQMHQIGTANELAVERVRNLVARSEEIETLTRLIAQVADQTNLLALNAAIEAARAGEQGRGFAVVAEEVRKLAEETAEMADKIGGTISSIVRDTEEVARSMEASSQEINKGVKLVNKAGEAFTGILAEVSAVKDFIDEIARLSSQLSDGGQQVMEGIAGVMDLAMEAAGHAGQAAASTEEQAAFLAEMHRLAGELQHEVLSLEEVVSKFLLEKIQVSCWEVMDCDEAARENCPAYHNEEKRCWLIPNTWCGGEEQGSAADKKDLCMNCRYFKKVFYDKNEA